MLEIELVFQADFISVPSKLRGQNGVIISKKQLQSLDLGELTFQRSKSENREQAA